MHSLWTPASWTKSGYGLPGVSWEGHRVFDVRQDLQLVEPTGFENGVVLLPMPGGTPRETRIEKGR
jgi:hypothetical protein